MPTQNLIKLQTFRFKLGQLLEIANELYGLDLKVRILEAENDINGGTAGPINLETGLKSVVVKYRLDFDNSEYVMTLNFNIREVSNLTKFFPKIITCFAPDEPFTISHKHHLYCNEKTIVIRWRSNYIFKLIHHS